METDFYTSEFLRSLRLGDTLSGIASRFRFFDLKRQMQVLQRKNQSSVSSDRVRLRLRFCVLFFVNEKSRLQLRLSVFMRSSFDFLSYGRVSFFFGLRKSPLDSFVRHRFPLSFQRKTSGWERIIRVRRFFLRVFGFVFFLSGWNRLRRRFVCSPLCDDRGSSLVDVFSKRFLYPGGSFYDRFAGKRKKYPKNSDSDGFVFRDRFDSYVFEQGPF